MNEKHARIVGNCSAPLFEWGSKSRLLGGNSGLETVETVLVPEGLLILWHCRGCGARREHISPAGSGPASGSSDELLASMRRSARALAGLIPADHVCTDWYEEPHDERVTDVIAGALARARRNLRQGLIDPFVAVLTNRGVLHWDLRDAVAGDGQLRRHVIAAAHGEIRRTVALQQCRLEAAVAFWCGSEVAVRPEPDSGAAARRNVLNLALTTACYGFQRSYALIRDPYATGGGGLDLGAIKVTLGGPAILLGGLFATPPG